MSQNSQADFKNLAANATGFLNVSLVISRHYGINEQKGQVFYREQCDRTQRSLSVTSVPLWLFGKITNNLFPANLFPS